MGEFGLMLPQNGGVQYLQDIHDIALSYGWHFALWSYRPDLEAGYMYFNPENWGSAYWNAILGFFGGNK